MGRLDDRAEPTQSDHSQSAETILRSVTQDLRNIQQDLLAQLQQDIRRLQAEKSRLLNDIEKLQTQQQTLQSQYEVAFSQQQLAQQQAWAKQMALILANHLHTALSERLTQSLSTRPLESGTHLPQLASEETPEQTQRMVASLDDTINRAFTALRHDLTSYQSALSQQISRMQDLGQQGEALLEVLVGRISQHLQLEAAKTQAEYRGYLSDRPTDLGMNLPAAPAIANGTPPMTNPALTGSYPSPTPEASSGQDLRPPDVPPPPPETETSSGSALSVPTPTAEPPVPGRHRFSRGSHFQLGLALVLLSTLALAIHTVVVFITGNPGSLGSMPIGGYLHLTNFRSSLLLLWVRMLVVVPLMVWLARRLYPLAWQDVKAFSQSTDRRLLWSVIASGFFLFVSQACVYIAIGQLGPGVAITVLFMYPIITIPLMGVLFGDRPTRLRLGVMGAIVIGGSLALWPRLEDSNAGTGLTTAVVAGVAFAFYLIAMQISFRKLHPVPVSMIQFFTMFVFTSLGLIVLGIDLAPANRLGLLVSGVILGGLTLLGYFFNDLGVRLMGAARAAILAASVPVLTALIAYLIIPSTLTKLQSVQIVGILIVTLGGAILGLERLLLQTKAANRRPSQKRVPVEAP